MYAFSKGTHSKYPKNFCQSSGTANEKNVDVEF